MSFVASTLTHSQIERLLAMRKIKDAVALLEYTSTDLRKEEREKVCFFLKTRQNSLTLAKKLRAIYKDSGLVLFRHLDLEEAFDYLKKSDIDPRQVIEFYPNLLSVDSDFEPTEKRTLITDLGMRKFHPPPYSN